jgi:hypothetical protein
MVAGFPLKYLAQPPDVVTAQFQNLVGQSALGAGQGATDVSDRLVQPLGNFPCLSPESWRHEIISRCVPER